MVEFETDSMNFWAKFDCFERKVGGYLARPRIGILSNIGDFGREVERIFEFFFDFGMIGV